MVLNIIALALVAAITFMHSIFGFYSGLINVFCTLISAIVAFGFWEAATDFITGATHLSAAYVGPTCLLLLFIGSLIILRTAADNWIRGNVAVPQWMNTGGAVLCGFVNAQVITGVLVISILMLPLGGNVLGFQRLTRVDGENNPDHPELPMVHRNSLWTRPDEMTVGIVDLVSAGSMRGATPFTSVYPNFTDTVFYTTNTVQPESTPAAYRDSQQDGFKHGIGVDGAWLETKELMVRYRQGVPSEKNPTPSFKQLSKPYKPAPGYELIGTRLKMKAAGADRKGRAAIHLFRPTMIRLVGTDGGTSEQYYPRILKNADPKLGPDIFRLVDFDNNFSVRTGDFEMEAYFEVPEGFKPRFVEYRRHARAAVVLSEGEPKGELTALKTEEQRKEEQRTGRLTFGTVASGSAESNRTPFTMDRDVLRRTCQMEGDKIVNGRFSGELDKFKHHTGGGAKVDEMKVPDGMAMVQVQYTPKQAQTLAGDVFNFVGQVNQYFAVDEEANRYPMVGYYGKTKRRGTEYVEFFLNGDPHGDTLLDPGYKSMLDFKSLTRDEINNSDDTTVIMFFFVKAGVEVRRIQNQTGDGGDITIKTRGG